MPGAWARGRAHLGPGQEGESPPDPLGDLRAGQQPGAQDDLLLYLDAILKFRLGLRRLGSLHRRHILDLVREPRVGLRPRFVRRPELALLIGGQGMVEGHAGRIAESPRRSVAGLSGQKKFRRAVARAFFQNLQRFMARRDTMAAKGR